MGATVQPQYRKDPLLEERLSELTSLLVPAEQEATLAFKLPERPTVFVMGPGRCGSSVLMQWLASTGKFAYPTNLLSRFYGALYIGSRIQQILTELDHRGEIFDFNDEQRFSSDQGKTKGALAPNEFWYFWRRFFPFDIGGFLTDEQLEQADGAGFAAELAAMEYAFQKPVAMKGMIANWNIPYIAELLPKSIFIHVTRHPYYNVQSKIIARDKYFGGRQREGWYSFKPEEYEQLKDLDPIEQVAGQVFFSNQAIEKGLSSVKPERAIRVSYETFCNSPRDTYHSIVKAFADGGDNLDIEYQGPSSFPCSNVDRLSNPDRIATIKAYERFSGVRIEP